MFWAKQGSLYPVWLIHMRKGNMYTSFRSYCRRRLEALERNVWPYTIPYSNMALQALVRVQACMLS